MHKLLSNMIFCSCNRLYGLLLALTAVTLVSNVALGQSLFGSRGNPNQSNASSTSQSSSLFSKIGTGLAPNRTENDSFVGRGSQGNRFVGRSGPRTVGQGESGTVRSRTSPSRGTSIQPRSSGTTPSEPTATRTSPGRRRTAVRPRHVVAFSYPVRSRATISGTLSSQLEELSETDERFANIKAYVSADGQVTLRGHVADESAKRLASALIRLEPGVRSVQNRLVVLPTIKE